MSVAVIEASGRYSESLEAVTPLSDCLRLRDSACHGGLTVTAVGAAGAGWTRILSKRDGHHDAGTRD